MRRLQRGADGMLQDADGETPLHKALAQVRHGCCCFILLQLWCLQRVKANGC